MNKQLQDRAWAALPKEFKEEVKKMFQTINTCNGMNQSMRCILVDLFSIHNLTSYSENLSEQKPAEEIANKAIEPVEKHFDNILKDSFRNERRLNIAAMAMQGILSNPQLLKIAIETYQEEIGSPDIYVAVAKAAKEQADALIDECKLTEKLKGE